jgi:class 3 adenylate cyclase/predicted ATPase
MTNPPIETRTFTTHDSIFHGHDLPDGTPVWVKRHRPEAPPADWQRQVELARLLEREPLVYQPHRDQFYLYLPGSVPFSEWLAERAGTVPAEVLLRQAQRLVDVLERWHRRGLALLGLAPEHLLYCPTTHEFLPMEWSRALAFRNASGAAESRYAAATLAYTSPEQSGKTDLPLDYRSDYFSLGVLLYRLATGQLPFEGSDDANTLFLLLAHEPPPAHVVNPAVPAALSVLIQKLLAKNPADRYQSAIGLRHDLGRILYESGGTFVPGRADSGQEFRLEPVFVGRQRVLSAVDEALDQARSTSGKAWIQLEGPSGSGKTALLDLLEDRYFNPCFLLRHDARDDQNAPYATLRTGLEALVHYLLSLPAEVVDNVRFHLETGLSGVLPALIEFCPAFAQLSTHGAGAPTPLLSTQATQYRLAYALAGFFKALVLTGRPVVWLIDNVQGSSDASLMLFDSLFRETSLGPFSVLATRDTDVPAGVPFTALTEAIQGLDVRWHPLPLPDLSPSEIATWLRQLRFHPEQVAALAALIRQKTGGTPYFVAQLLARAQRLNHIEAVPDTAFFRVLESELAAYEATHNLLGFLTERIQQLPPAVRTSFNAVACFQSQFSSPELRTLLGQSAEVVQDHLRTLVQAGILIRLPEPDTYTFSNPQLADIGQRLLSPDERTAAFGRVVAYLLTLPPETTLSAHPFRLATRLLELPPEQGLRHAPHLLRAARQAAGIGAFDLARRCYAYALRALTPADWERDYDACFEQYCQYLRAASFSADTTELFDEVLAFLQRQVRTRFHAAALATVRAEHLAYQQRLDESIQVILPVLQQFGIRLRYSPSVPLLIWSLVRANFLLRNKTTEALEHLPEIQDAEASYVVKLLQVSQDAVYLSRPLMLPETILVQLRLSLRSGLSEISGAGFMAYAFMRSAMQGKYHDAKEKMELGLRLHRRFGAVSFEASGEFLKALFIDHWLGPLQNSIDQLHANYRRCREVGLLSMSFYSLGSASVYEFYSGLPREVVLRKSLEGLHLGESQQQARMAVFFRIVAQGCYDLSHANPATPIFNGPYSTFAREEAYLKASNDSSSLSILLTFHLKISVLLQRSERAVPFFKRLLVLSRQTGEGSYTDVTAYFFGGLACLQSPERPRGEASRLAKRSIARLRTFSRAYAGNNLAKYEILRGVYALRTGQPEQGLLALDRAIEAATQYHLPLDEALAHEYKGTEYARLGNLGLAQRELREAMALYKAWGAPAKVAQLRAAYPFVTPVVPAPATPDAPADDERGASDLLSLLKASNSIASSIRLDGLLQNLLDVLLENAGAQKAALLLNEPTGLRVYALQEYGADRSQVPTPLADAPLPQNLIRYVVRTAQPLTLAQAYTDRIFSTDAYFQKHRTLSALAMPVIKNQQCLAVIYLENNSTPGAFNRQRLETLQLLSAQIAISLENALLYDDMESRIRDRTEQLQQEMEKSERLLLNILPQAVAQELKQNGQATARQFADVTVLFTDFVNFTRISELMEPDELVSELDLCFRTFDEITARYGIEKIKTIGDAYLAAGGLHDDDGTDHPVRVVRAALDIRDFIAGRKAQRQAAQKPYFDLRIGVHNGPVVAGVVGSRKFAYDIWGDTVNTAARMEQSSEPGQVNVSGHTWAVVQHAFTGTFRGQVRAKNKGEIEMYFVTGPK